MSVKQVFPSGRYVDLLGIEAAVVDVHDVARALSLIPRFGGSTFFPYSVAQHCLAASDIMARANFSKRAQLAALLHDAEEAYFGDIPTPIKYSALPPMFRALMRKAREEIKAALGVRAPIEDEPFVNLRIAEVDHWLLFAERNVLMPSTELDPKEWAEDRCVPQAFTWIAAALGVPKPATYAAIPPVPIIEERPWRSVEQEFLARCKQLGEASKQEEPTDEG